MHDNETWKGYQKEIVIMWRVRPGLELNKKHNKILTFVKSEYTYRHLHLLQQRSKYKTMSTQ